MGRKKVNKKIGNKGPTYVKSSRTLAPDESQLWQRVKHTIEPKEKLEELSDEFSKIMSGEKSGSSNTPSKIAKKLKSTTAVEPEKKHPTSYNMPSYSPPKSKQTSGLNSPIDRPTMRKLAKGRLNIDARIDLHGQTQLQAHRTLLNFVEDAYASSYRIILVITGKGRIREGILRSSVPQWLQQNEFSTYVSGYKISHPSHGGEGALYVRIRRNKQ